MVPHICPQLADVGLCEDEMMAWWKLGRGPTLALVYLVGFAFCWLSLSAFLRIEGRRGSILALVLFVNQEFLRHRINHFSGHELIAYPPFVSSLSVILSSGIVALAFPAVWCLVVSGKKWLRWPGLLLLALLLFMGLYWGKIDNAVFDPAPRHPEGWPSLQ